MENVLKWIQPGSLLRAKTTAGEKCGAQQRQALVEELQEVKRALACNEAWFQMECRDGLVEACIYEREALRARRRALLEQARQLAIRQPPF